MKEILEKLFKGKDLSLEDLVFLIENRNEETALLLSERAREIRETHYGKDIYIRALIEFSNYCKNDCYYCGIRKSNSHILRYRLSEEEILESAKKAHGLGFRTFVLQGGEDGHFTPERVETLIKEIKGRFSDSALTLSMGEQKREVYARWFSAGADRYLLRHETADEKHYSLLHPDSLSFSNRMRCLYDLKEIGFQVGCGFMVGSPFQTAEMIAKDLLFIKNFNPDMVGIGPFIPAKNTPFECEKAGSVELTLYLLSIIRIMLPLCLLPATTALSTLDKEGLEKGILAGANVIMPNLSPPSARENYCLYEGKRYTDGENLDILRNRMSKIGYEITTHRGDRKGFDINV